MNRAEGLRAQIAQIDGLLKECEGRPQLDRFVQHLNTRRESMINMISMIEKQGDVENGAQETECDGKQRADEPVRGI